MNYHWINVLGIIYMFLIYNLKSQFIKGHKDEAFAYLNVLKINKSGE